MMSIANAMKTIAGVKRSLSSLSHGVKQAKVRSYEVSVCLSCCVQETFI